MQRIAMIDIGSNSARLVINRIYKNKSYNMIYSQKETLRLSQRVDKEGNITPEGIKMTLSTLNNFGQMCKLYKVEKILAVCTAAIRNAANSEDVLKTLREQTNIPLTVISGKQEAYYSFLGAVNSLALKDALLFDLGGGSLELILVRDRQIIFSDSIPIGAVNVTESFDVNNADPTIAGVSYKDMYNFLTDTLKKVPWIRDVNLPLVGIGGTARTIAKVIQKRTEYNYHKLHNYTFSYELFSDFYCLLKRSNYSQKCKIPGLSADRVDIILAGTSIIDVLFKVSGSTQSITSGYGVRDGLFYEYYFNSLNKEPVMADVLVHSVETTQKLYGADVEHAARVAGYTYQMFNAWYTLHRLPPSYGKILRVASLLHDLGININYYNHEQHSAYIIESMQLFGLTHYEQILSAVVACWHGGITQSYFKYHIYKNVLTEDDWQIARKLSIFLALGETLDYSQLGIISDIQADLSQENNAMILAELTDKAVKPTIELAQARKLSKWFYKEFKVNLLIGVK